ncbi:hypothetical protein M5K25_025898 [Dendrobium thyrsiflorum]|uniref:Uncharacterized protein n=1 Tax=Dendrobium thyrsiflorum TaxID=117978 RepID=A0ABD0TVX9_DENTH
MAFRAYFIILLFFILVPCFTDCRAIIGEEIPQISKVAGGFPSKFHTNLMDLTKRRKLIAEMNPDFPSRDGLRTVTNLTDPLPCIRCYYVPRKVQCHCHK